LTKIKRKEYQALGQRSRAEKSRNSLNSEDLQQVTELPGSYELQEFTGTPGVHRNPRKLTGTPETQMKARNSHQRQELAAIHRKSKNSHSRKLTGTLVII
jgi:hypothetical protein